MEKRNDDDNDRADCDTSVKGAYQRHKPYSIGYYVSSVRADFTKYRSFRGERCVTWFVEELFDLAHRAKQVFLENMAMPTFTPNDLHEFLNATHCHICKGRFHHEEQRVRDHCHLTGRYRGPAHSRCNLHYKNAFVIPIFFHNLTGYDAHFIINDVANMFEGSVELLPITKEKYISFTKTVSETGSDRWGLNNVRLRFVDSFKFLNASLDKLVSHLDKDKLTITRSQFSSIGSDDFDLLTRKGVFPYEYVDSFNRLDETSLPPYRSFYSSLTDEIVPESDYCHALNVWQRFHVTTIGEYSDLYLKTDVLLLADVFENFRVTCMGSYGLDPAHYYTLPGYTWDAMLKYTDIRFELLTDIDMLLFIERGVRGGLSQCSNRYARANNKYAPMYDPSRPSSYLMYYDINNLYGWAMSQSLPYAEFQWVDPEHFDIQSLTPDSSIGYILEVDLAYPFNIHDAHADLPFCPTRERPPGRKIDKLLATLRDKQRYVMHYRNLQQVLEHGLKLVKIHRILGFRQSRWLSGYIELNTALRSEAAR